MTINHHNRSYSNELGCEIDVTKNKQYKNKDSYISLDEEQFNSEKWLKTQMSENKVKIEKYINKKQISQKLQDSKDVSETKKSALKKYLLNQTTKKSLNN